MRYFLFLMLIAAVPSYAQNKVRIDERAFVTFPGKSEQMPTEAGMVNYGMLDPDNKVTGMATVIDATQYGVDSAMIAANYNNSFFVDMVLQGLMGQYPGVAMVSKKKIARGRFMGYELEFRNDHPDERVPYEHLYARVLFAGARIYALTVLAEKDVDAAGNRDRFFNTLELL